MHTFDKNTLALAIALSMLAGCIDAIGFMQLGGYFVSFMSGNSTRLAVALQQGNWHAAGILSAIIVCFVSGAALGATVRNYAALKHKATRISVLMLITSLLFTAALCDSSGLTSASMLIIAIAMGAENSVLQGKDDNVIGVTYMTGTLVKIGHRIAATLQGDGNFSWLPYLLLWLGLITGGVTGAFLFAHDGFYALWFPTVWAGLLTVVQYRRSPPLNID